MTDRDAVEAVEEPLTVDGIAPELTDLGVSSGDSLLVHASRGSLGWVDGGA
jgi:aminoglycoside 3-N-acetyltransferase